MIYLLLQYESGNTNTYLKENYKIMKNEEIIKANVKVGKKLYYNNTYGVFSFKLNESDKPINIDEKWNTFVANGTVPELIEGNTYDIEIEPSWNKKYGDGYSIVSVASKRPSTIKDQQEYVKMVVTDKQYKALINKYPDEPLLDMFENDEIDYSDIKGISKKTYDKIKDNLFNQMETTDLASKLRDLDVTFNSADKLLKHFGNADIVLQIVKDNIYRLCEVNGFGYKKIDEYAMRRGDDPKGIGRITAATNYLLEQDAQKGHSWMYKSDMIDLLHELLKLDLDFIEEFIFGLTNKENNLYIDDKKIAPYNNYKYELKIKEKLFKMINSPCKTSGVEFEKIIAELEKRNGFEYADEQREAIKKAVDNNVMVINGKAGSGKTTILKGVVNSLRDYSYHSACLSGKGAKVLSTNGLTSSTIHRMLGRNEKTGGFKHNEDDRLPYDIIILDETSMVNIYLIYSIVIALKDDAKIIFVGDSGQLPSIGVGSVFDDLLKSSDVPRQELTKIHRQAQKSGILTVANTIRTGKQINNLYEYDIKVFGELKDMVLMPVQDKSHIQNIILSICEKYKENDLFEFQVLTSMRERGELSVKTLNNLLQPIINPNRTEGIKSGWYEYKVGDKIIQNGNNYEANVEVDEFNELLNDSFGYEYEEDDHELVDEVDISKTVEVYNGTMGKIIRIEQDEKKNYKIYIKFEDIDEIVVYERSDLQQIDLAYAITVHKCVTPDTFVVSDRGIMKIKDAVKIDGLKIHNGRYFEKPNAVVEYKNEETVRIETQKGYSLEGTLDHRIYALNEDGDLTYLNMRELKEKDNVIIIKNTQAYSPDLVCLKKYDRDMSFDVRAKLFKKPQILNEELALLMGMMTADGTIAKEKIFKYSKRHKECVEEFVRLVENLFGYTKEVPIRLRPSGDYMFEGSSRDIATYLLSLGGLAPHNKDISDLILQSPESVQCAYLKGLFEDGTVNIKKDKFDHIEFSQQSKSTIDKTQMMLLNMGIASTRRLRKKGKHSLHVLYIYKKDARVFKSKIGFMCDMKTKRLDLCDAESKLKMANTVFPNINKKVSELVKKYNLNLKNHEKATLRTSVNVSNLVLEKVVNELRERQVKCKEAKFLYFLNDSCLVDKVTKIENGLSDTYCFEMKESSSFIQNGIYGMNSQGSTLKHVLFALDYSAYMMLSREMVYTAITRASKGCVVVTENKAFHHAIEKTTGDNRRTFLKELLVCK